MGFSPNNNNNIHQARGPRGVRGRTRYPDDTATERLIREGHENRRRLSQQIREARSREQAEARRRLSVQRLEELERSRRRDEEMLDQSRRLWTSSTNDNLVREPDVPQQPQLTDTDANREYAERFERAQRAVAEIERQRAERGEGELGALVTIEAYSYGSESSSDYDDDDEDGNESDSTADSMPPLILCHNGEDAAADNDNNAEGEAVD